MVNTKHSIGGRVKPSKHGVQYRYLVPKRERANARAGSLQKAYDGLPIEFRISTAETFHFSVETVLCDAGTDRRLGLMVAPTKQPEYDIVLGSETASRFQDSFESCWS